MIDNKFRIPPEDLQRQEEYKCLAGTVIASRYIHPKAFVRTYGCQGNVADGERIKGILETLGYEITDAIDEADFILYNTCAIREHAEDRVFGNLGRIKARKDENPNLIVAVCGCMTQQERVAERIKKSFRFVDIVFGTHVIFKLPEFVYRVLCEGERVFDLSGDNGCIVEGLPVKRDGSFKAWVPIMYGCDNFCSYCIVPYVRGRERSRDFDLIVDECKALAAGGYKEITLLGQNVNSYNRDLPEEKRFPALLRAINNIEGDFTIRFMTSHPKDCSFELIDAIHECTKVERHLHLPVQSGNDRILKAMNRHYDREKYLSLVDYAYKKIPDLAITSDIIVGFPGETEKEFEDTLTLVERVKYTSLYTFIFSPRPGTKAFDMPDPFSREEKGKRFNKLLSLQESIAAKRTASMNGKTYRVLVEEKSKNDGFLAGRTSSNIIIEFPGDESLIGTHQNVKITEPKTWVLFGELV